MKLCPMCTRENVQSTPSVWGLRNRFSLGRSGRRLHTEGVSSFCPAQIITDRPATRLGTILNGMAARVNRARGKSVIMVRKLLTGLNKVFSPFAQARFFLTFRFVVKEQSSLESKPLRVNHRSLKCAVGFG